MKKKTSSININVELDKNKIPEKINWKATDEGDKSQEAKAFLLSIWDAKKIETLKIDLWVKDMTLEHMKIFFYQSLVAMSDTFYKSTKDEKMSLTFKDFCDYFAEKMDLKK
jgi:gliding motility-associated protein GldC